MKTNREVKAACFYESVMAPIGADVVKIEGAGGGYALHDPRRYGANPHDAKYRYYWVPEDAVEK